MTCDGQITSVMGVGRGIGLCFSKMHGHHKWNSKKKSGFLPTLRSTIGDDE